MVAKDAAEHPKAQDSNPTRKSIQPKCQSIGLRLKILALEYLLCFLCLVNSNSPTKTQLKCHHLCEVFLYQPGPLLQMSILVSFSPSHTHLYFSTLDIRLNFCLFTSISLLLAWEFLQGDHILLSFIPRAWVSAWQIIGTQICAI